MNIFYLSSDAITAAKFHCDKHVVKMITETAQLLCCAHRIFDGTPVQGKTASGRKATRWILKDPEKDAIMYTATHMKHPDSLWIQSSAANYMWSYQLMMALNDEFKRRYNHTEDHGAVRKLKHYLAAIPENMDKNGVFTEPPRCMPEECKDATSVIQSYYNYYNQKKTAFAKWRGGNIPEWYKPEN